MPVKPGSIAQRALEYLRARPGEHLMSKAATDLNCSVPSVSSALYELKREGLTDFRKRGDHVRAPLAWWATRQLDDAQTDDENPTHNPSRAGPDRSGSDPGEELKRVVTPINGHRAGNERPGRSIAADAPQCAGNVAQAAQATPSGQNEKAAHAEQRAAGYIQRPPPKPGHAIGAHDEPVPRFAMWSSLRLSIVLSDGTKATLTRGDTRALLSFIAELSREVIEAAQDDAR